MAQPGIELGIFHTVAKRLSTWSTQTTIKMKVHLVIYIVDTAIIKGMIQ